MRTRIKICCIQDVEEAKLAVRFGADAIGLVSAMPSGLGPIPEEKIAEIARTVPAGVATFLLTSKQDSAGIIAQQKRCGTNTLQLCDQVSVEELKAIRVALPGIVLVQVIHVAGPESVAEALAAAPHVNALLLDSGNQRLAVKELGGTGRTHDWSVSREIRDRAGVPVFLAGGLTPENIADAITTVEPFGVDVCSGIRTPDSKLDRQKLAAFVNRSIILL